MARYAQLFLIMAIVVMVLIQFQQGFHLHYISSSTNLGRHLDAASGLGPPQLHLVERVSVGALQKEKKEKKKETDISLSTTVDTHQVEHQEPTTTQRSKQKASVDPVSAADVVQHLGTTKAKDPRQQKHKQQTQQLSSSSTTVRETASKYHNRKERRKYPPSFVIDSSASSSSSSSGKRKKERKPLDDPIITNNNNSKPNKDPLLVTRRSSSANAVGDDKSIIKDNAVVERRIDLQTTTNPRQRQETQQQRRQEQQEPQQAKEQSNVNDDRPLFILHVGLPKTATTHLKCKLCGDYPVTGPELMRDRFVYLGTCPWGTCDRRTDYEKPQEFLKHSHESFFEGHAVHPQEPNGNTLGPFPHRQDPKRVSTTRQEFGYETPKLRLGFKRRVEVIHRDGHNAMVIFEGFDALSQLHIQTLADYLNPNWQVHVVVAYRPLFAWLPSKYNSVVKPSRNRAARAWPGQEYKLRYGDKRVILGEEIPPFALDNRSSGHSPSIQRRVDGEDNLFGDYVRDIEVKYQMHPTQMVMENFAQFFNHVHVMSLPHLNEAQRTGDIPTVSDPLLHYLFCQLLPGRMPHTCQLIQHGHLGNGQESEKTNPSVELNYDILAVHAYQEGLIQVSDEDDEDSETSRSSVAEKIRKRQEAYKGLSGNDFPLKCLANETFRLEKLSWLVEQNLFSSSGGNSIEADQALHQKGFVDALAGGKYCSIDAKKTLQQDDWRSWFLKHYHGRTDKQMKQETQQQQRREQQEQQEPQHPKEQPNVDNDRPLFILHVGLPKTATTHLQCKLCGDYPVTEPMLMRDRFVYLGTCPWGTCDRRTDYEKPQEFLKHFQESFFEGHPVHPQEPNGNTLGPFPHRQDPKRVSTTRREFGYETPKLKLGFKQLVEVIHRDGHNAMVIFEGFDALSQLHIQTLADYLNPNWQVHVVVAYRPLFAWLPSKYNSIVKPSRNRAARAWPGQEYKLRYGDKRVILGEEIPPFALDNRSSGHSPSIQRRVDGEDNLFGDYVRDIEVRYQMHPTQMVMENFAQFFNHVHVMSLPHLNEAQRTGDIPKVSDPLLHYLFCQLLPGRMPHTCQLIQHGHLGNGQESEKTNPSVELNYDILAVHAYQEGLILVSDEDDEDSETSRSSVAHKIRKRQEAYKGLSGNDFPLKCLANETLSRLEKLSWLVEQNLFSSGGGNSIEADQALHQKGFVDASAGGKYCSIDAKKTLQQDDWRSWFLKHYHGKTDKQTKKKRSESTADADDEDDNDHDNKKERSDSQAVGTSRNLPVAVSRRQEASPSNHSAYETTLYSLKRAKGQGWQPRLTEIEEAEDFEIPALRFEQLFFSPESQTVAETTKGPKRREEFLAFVRIQKTGSTSIFRLLRHCAGLYPQGVFLNKAFFADEEYVHDYSRKLGCVYGLPTADMIPDDFDKNEYSCSHTPLTGVLQGAAQVLHYLKGSSDNAEVSIHPFTMVREPFDRLQSIFYYMYSRRQFPMWKSAFTEQQNRRVAENDLAGWMESLHRDGTPKQDLNLLNQRFYFSKDMNTAKQLVNNGRILTLVMECFDVSIKLLVDIFPHLFSKAQIDSLLSPDQQNYETNETENGKSFLHSNSLRNQRNMDVDTLKAELDLDQLRAKALTWFHEEFEFYNIVVERFQKNVRDAFQLPGTLLTQTEVDQCFQKLDNNYKSLK